MSLPRGLLARSQPLRSQLLRCNLHLSKKLLTCAVESIIRHSSAASRKSAFGVGGESQLIHEVSHLFEYSLPSASGHVWLPLSSQKRQASCCGIVTGRSKTCILLEN